MKKIMLIILASFMFVGCEQATSESAGVIQRTDDLSTKVKQIAEDYVSKNFEIANETYSDTVQARFNSTEVQGKENLIGGWHVEHKVFSDISIEDQYAHTNYTFRAEIYGQTTGSLGAQQQTKQARSFRLELTLIINGKMEK